MEGQVPNNKMKAEHRLSFNSETELDWIATNPDADLDDNSQQKHPHLKIDLILILDLLRAGKRPDLIADEDRSWLVEKIDAVM